MDDDIAHGLEAARWTLLLAVAGSLWSAGCGDGSSLGRDHGASDADAAGPDAPDGAEAGVDADADGRDWPGPPDTVFPSEGFADHGLSDAEEPESADCTPRWGGECNAEDQCGCRAGERCVLTPPDDPTTEICVSAGVDPAGTPCVDPVDDCVAGSQCLAEWYFDGYRWACTPFCREDIDCPGGWICGCGIGPDGADSYSICCQGPDDCDPLTGAGCPETQACFWSLDGTRCVWGGSAGPGDPCDGDEACRPGTGCYGVGTPFEMLCFLYCRLDGLPPDCSEVPGTVCSGIGSPVIGWCIEPE